MARHWVNEEVGKIIKEKYYDFDEKVGALVIAGCFEFSSSLNYITTMKNECLFDCNGKEGLGGYFH